MGRRRNIRDAHKQKTSKPVLEQQMRQLAQSLEQFLYCLERISNTCKGLWKGPKRCVHLKTLNACGSLNKIHVEVRSEKMTG